jgi:uncharacterized membrane protein
VKTSQSTESISLSLSLSLSLLIFLLEAHLAVFIFSIFLRELLIVVLWFLFYFQALNNIYLIQIQRSELILDLTAERFWLLPLGHLHSHAQLENVYV